MVHTAGENCNQKQSSVSDLTENASTKTSANNSEHSATVSDFDSTDSFPILQNDNQNSNSSIEPAQTSGDEELKPEDLKAIENPLANFYANYIQEHPNNFPPHGILIEDINGDGQDEMVLQINPYGYMEIVYVKNGEPKVINCEVMSMWGGTWYDKVKNRIINEYYHGHTEGTAGGYEFYIYDWNDEDYVLTMHLERKPGYYEREADGVTRTDIFIYGQAYLNDEKITNEKFEELYAELQSIQKPENVLEVVTSGEFELSDELKKKQSERYNAYLREKFGIE